MNTRRFLALAAIAALTAQPALAHRFWIISSTSVLSGDDSWVTFDSASSNNLFFPNHRAPELDAFTATGPDGKPLALQNGNKGQFRTTFDLQLTQPGTYRVATVRSMLGASWQENGETQRWRGTVEELAKVADKPGVEVSQNQSRTETFVTSGEPTPPAPTGKGLELVFTDAHPNDLFSGEPATFTLHHDGAPAANVKVTVIKGDDRYRNDVGEITATTDETGKFSITWPKAGRYWLNASAEGGSTEIAGIQASSRASYTATFEVLPE